MRRPARLAMAFGALAASLALTACSGTVGNIQRSVDRTVMQTMVGRTYALVTALPPRLPFEVDRDPPYGRLFSVTDLRDGSRVYRHLIRSVGETTTTSVFGIVQSDSQRFSYRLLYFLVDRQGVITATANGYWLGEEERCVGYVGNIFRTCENSEALADDVVFFDTLVRTADDRPIEAWLQR